MTRYLLSLNTKADRAKAVSLIQQAPIGTRLELKAAKHTNSQSALMWSMLSAIALQKEHHGRKYTPDNWKIIFLAALGREVQFIPSLDGKAFIPFGQSSSDLSKHEISQLIEFIQAWIAEQGIELHEK